jgi:hypothetical protein
LNRPANIPLNFVAVRQMTAEGKYKKMASDLEVRMKQRCVIEFLHAEKIAPNDIDRCLLNVYGDQTVDVSTVRRWVARFSSGDSDAKDKPRSGRPCAAVTPRNKEHLDQLICTNRQITTRELCMELNISCNALEAMVATLEYRKVCTRWVPPMLTQEHKEHRMQVCQDLLNQYKAEGDSFLDRIITGDETWRHHYARPHTSLKTMEHIANLGWIVLPHPLYSPDLAPSDFHLFRPIKDGLRGQHFPSNNAVIQAVKQWATSTGADFYECGMQALVHRWRKCIANRGDYVEK